MNNNKNKNVRVVVLSDCGGALTAKIFASRENLVELSKVDDCYPMQAVKLVFGELAPGDFIVRSVLAGRRRKVEIIAAGDNHAIEAVIERTRGEKRRVTGREGIEYVEGDEVIDLANTALVAAPKARA
ncbi:MAG: hypothetical protein IPK73_00705 [Candidatus Obscuribacter sp.]|nr:hypothetical protein [Candidatus Obscuribacter sp.]MBK9280481.1 hypothetical protein [Candidatus Obscuribacter sp.]